MHPCLSRYMLKVQSHCLEQNKIIWNTNRIVFGLEILGKRLFYLFFCELSKTESTKPYKSALYRIFIWLNWWSACWEYPEVGSKFIHFFSDVVNFNLVLSMSQGDRCWSAKIEMPSSFATTNEFCFCVCSTQNSYILAV